MRAPCINNEDSKYRVTNLLAYMETFSMALHFDVMPISTDKISCFHKIIINIVSWGNDKVTLKYCFLNQYVTCPFNDIANISYT